MKPTRTHPTQPASPLKTYWFLSFTGSLMPSIGQALSRSAPVWASLLWNAPAAGNGRPWGWGSGVRPFRRKSSLWSCRVSSSTASPSRGLVRNASRPAWEEVRPNAEHTSNDLYCPPNPPPFARSFPLSSFFSSSSPLSGSIPICICNALLLWPRFRLKKLPFHSFRIKPSHSPTFVVVGSNLGLLLPRRTGHGTRDGFDLLFRVAKNATFRLNW